MKLLNYTTSYFSVVLLLIISVWAGIFYYAMLDEIYDSIDDGLDNRKGLIILSASKDTALLRHNGIETDFRIREIGPQAGLSFRDRYIDTSMYMQNEKDYEPVRLLRTVFVQDGRYFQMDVFTSMVEEDDLVTELLYALLWLYVGLVATIILLNNFLLRHIWQPFYRLLEQLRNFRLEKPEPVSAPPGRVDEFNMLQETADRLLQNNLQTYNSQKAFTENAAHELQTPLAISINKLETLAESKNLNSSEAATLSAAIDQLERLVRINRSLLLLSRIENRQYAETSLISVNDLVRRLGEDLEEMAAYREVSMTVRESGSCTVHMNAALASVMLGNLFRNAITHNRAGGNILVTIGDRELRVSNTGQDDPLDAAKIFTRFYKGRQSESTTGLGLSIVKAIADLYGFRVYYSFDGRHQIRVMF